eukprot:9096306-Pyramimonas_sp.AAC.1
MSSAGPRGAVSAGQLHLPGRRGIRAGQCSCRPGVGGGVRREGARGVQSGHAVLAHGVLRGRPGGKGRGAQAVERVEPALFYEVKGLGITNLVEGLTSVWGGKGACNGMGMTGAAPWYGALSAVSRGRYDGCSSVVWCAERRVTRAVLMCVTGW